MEGYDEGDEEFSSEEVQKIAQNAVELVARKSWKETQASRIKKTKLTNGANKSLSRASRI